MPIFQYVTGIAPYISDDQLKSDLFAVMTQGIERVPFTNPDHEQYARILKVWASRFHAAVLTWLANHRAHLLFRDLNTCFCSLCCLIRRALFFAYRRLSSPSRTTTRALAERRALARSHFFLLHLIFKRRALPYCSLCRFTGHLFATRGFTPMESG